MRGKREKRLLTRLCVHMKNKFPLVVNGAESAKMQDSTPHPPPTPPFKKERSWSLDLVVLCHAITS